MRIERLLVISIGCLFLLAGCAASTNDLIKEAQRTGDWTDVNKRFVALERHEARFPKSCPGSMKSMCVVRSGTQNCTCVSETVFRDRLGYRQNQRVTH